MPVTKLNTSHFKFKYLPDYASYLLKNKLEEFVLVGIRFSREIDLPLLKPLAKLSEQELVKISVDSNRETLNALRESQIAEHIEINLKNWVENKLIVDKGEIAAEDLTLAFYVKRKMFTYFLYSYTPNTALHQLIVSEVDTYTTYEELAMLKVYLHIHNEHL